MSTQGGKSNSDGGFWRERSLTELADEQGIKRPPDPDDLYDSEATGAERDAFMAAIADYPFHAQRFGRLIVTTCRQSTCRRIVDRAYTRDRENNLYKSVTIILRPWHRNQWGDYLSQRALVIGWRKSG